MYVSLTPMIQQFSWRVSKCTRIIKLFGKIINIVKLSIMTKGKQPAILNVCTYSERNKKTNRFAKIKFRKLIVVYLEIRFWLRIGFANGKLLMQKSKHIYWCVWVYSIISEAPLFFLRLLDTNIIFMIYAFKCASE